MAVHFHSLKVKKIIRETPECVSISFDVPENIQKEFMFREGQNITIRHKNGAEEIRRSYSICNAPHEMELKVAVKKVPGGIFSAYANDELKTGDLLEILPPSGKFNAKLSNKPGEHFLAIAAGSGITPVISIIKHTLNTKPDARFTLLYVNRNRQSIIFFDELESLKNKFMNRFQLINILSRERLDTELFYGRLDAEKLKELEQLVPFATVDQAYICGPEAMIFTAKDFLETKGVSTENIHFELFTTPGVTSTASEESVTAHETGAISHVSIHLDGRTMEFDLPMDGPSILDAALKQGADLPYACKGGVCATCRAKLEEGKVDMTLNYALEKEEIEQGFILTCQSHPRTTNIIVNFDVR